MLDYTNAARLYEGRKDKHIGRKVRNGIYMKYDSVRDCFVVSVIWSTYEVLFDQDHLGQFKYHKLPKERWELRTLAEVYRDRIVITIDIGNTTMYALFRVQSFASRTVKLSGRIWRYNDSTQECQTINGDLPIMIKDDKLSSLTPSKVRVMNSEKRNEMNRMIRSVRNLIKVRTKLGAFDKLTHVQLSEYTHQTYGDSIWQELANPAGFLKLLRAVDPENLKSFYPLLWLTGRYRPYNWNYRNGNVSFGRIDWVARYNNLINHMREKVRRELGVVKYVEAAEQSADSPDRANEPREVQVPVSA